LHPSVYDPAYYLRQHPELASAEAAKKHWLSTGIGNGDKASSIFHSTEYLAQYPDLRAAFGAKGYAAAIEHYVSHGRKVGRLGLIVADQSYVHPPYDHSVAPLKSSVATGKGWSESFTDTEGNSVTVSIQAPPAPTGPQEIYSRAMRPDESPDRYFPALIAEAVKAKAKKIVVPKGVYEFKPTEHGTSGQPHWRTDGLVNMEIDGGGSELHFSEPRIGIVLNGPKRIALKNFTIDWPKLRIASLGRIVTGPDGKNALRLNEPVQPGQSTDVQVISEYDLRRDAWAIKPQNEWSVSSQSQLKLDADRMTYESGGFQGFPTGAAVIARHFVVGFAVGVGGGSDVSFENIKIYAGPGMGFFLTGVRGGIRIVNCVIDRRDSPSLGKRPISTALDAVHISDVTGDVLLENNRLAYQGDDGFNLHANLTHVTEVSGDHIALGWNFAAVGEPLLFFNSGLGFLGTAKVTQITKNSTGASLIELDRAPEGLNSESYVAKGDAVGARFILRHNQFVNNRARALLISTPHGLIENNVMSGQTLAAVLVDTDVGVFSIGPGAYNVMVKGNSITGSGEGFVVSAHAVSGNADFPVNQKIQFQSNRVKNVTGPAFLVGAAQDVKLEQNVIENANQRTKEGFIGTADLRCPIVLSHTHSAHISASNKVSITDGRAANAVRCGVAGESIDTTSTSSIDVSR
jgi:hypothetical protein